jgi:hypothetical protein
MTAMKKILCVALFAACGGGSGSGVDSSKKLSDLTVAEVNQECNYAFETYPEKTITCPDSTTRTKGSKAADRATQCSATANRIPAGCTATVGQAEQCLEDVYNESDAALCANTIPPSCAPLLSAACQGTGRTQPMSGSEAFDLAQRLSR